MRVTAFAPGRVNLIGDHTDHTGGLVMPMAIELGTTVVAERGGDRVHLRSDSEPHAVDMAIDLVDPASVDPPWGRYIAGVVASLRPASGCTGTVTTTLPVGAGLSSSASLTVAVALALGADPDPASLAGLCQRAEQIGTGVPCGIMDQLVVAAGVQGSALVIDTGAVTWEAVAMPPNLEVRVIDSGQARTLAGSGYAEVRDRCVAAQERLGDLKEAERDAWRHLDDPGIRGAARHVIGENQRVRELATAMRSGDAVAMGTAMVESHRSLAELGVSTSVLDALVDRLVATPGVLGARLTGAGFGGCVVALTEPGAVAEGWLVRPSAGASVSPG